MALIMKGDFMCTGMSVEEVQKIFPMDRIYEVPFNNDVYKECREFEIADTWRVVMKCIGIDRKRGIAKYKRDEVMHFGNIDV